MLCDLPFTLKASLMVCISQRFSKENGNLLFWWENPRHLSTNSYCPGSCTAQEKKQRKTENYSKAWFMGITTVILEKYTGAFNDS